MAAMLDSGFNGGMTLPPDKVAALGLQVDHYDIIVLANGEQIQVATYLATLLWNGIERKIPVFATGDFPLLGMRALTGYRFCVDVTEDGGISIRLLRRAKRPARKSTPER